MRSARLRILIAPFGLDIAMDRGRPESRVVFVQLPIRESVVNHCKGVRRPSGNIFCRKGLPRFSLCAAEQEYLLDDPLKVSRTETCKTTKSTDANKFDFSYFASL
jgi:hypothetical protein